jgi:hypothetical protein
VALAIFVWVALGLPRCWRDQGLNSASRSRVLLTNEGVEAQSLVNGDIGQVDCKGQNGRSAALLLPICKSRAMCKAGILLLLLWCAWTADAQGVRTMPPKLPPTNKPVCSQGAICFSGEVSAGEEFRKELNSQLDFVLKPGCTCRLPPGRLDLRRFGC